MAQALVPDSKVEYRRSIELGVGPPVRWHCAQLVCKYARARCASGAAMSNGSGIAGLSAGSPSGVWNTVMPSNVRNWLAVRPVFA
jgi:hypothetical protein